jgi:hypothetical protein
MFTTNDAESAIQIVFSGGLADGELRVRWESN